MHGLCAGVEIPESKFPLGRKTSHASRRDALSTSPPYASRRDAPSTSPTFQGGVSELTPSESRRDDSIYKNSNEFAGRQPTTYIILAPCHLITLLMFPCCFGAIHRITIVAAIPPTICAVTNHPTSTGLIPANVSLRHLAIVTAGFANDVDAVNQYAAVM